MLLDERRRAILQTLEEQGFASLQDLVDRVDASESTVRRDLEYLDEIGQIRRTRGGAALVGESVIAVEEREPRAYREKRAIAEHVARLIEDDETVLLDGGTTTLEIARLLTGPSLQVLTNSLPIANLLVQRHGVELIFLGGLLYPRTGVALGPLLKSALREVHARRLIMGAGGITEQGLFNKNTLLVEAEREMMAVAEEVIVVCDSSKIGHVALAHLCELEQIDRIVIDSGVTHEWRTILEDAGVTVDVVRP